MARVFPPRAQWRNTNVECSEIGESRALIEQGGRSEGYGQCDWFRRRSFSRRLVLTKVHSALLNQAYGQTELCIGWCRTLVVQS